MLAERGTDICPETVWFWWNRFGALFAAEIRKRRERRAALEFLERTMRRYGRPNEIVTDRLRSYRAARKESGMQRPRSVVDSATIELRSCITRFDDTKGRWPNSGM